MFLFPDIPYARFPSNLLASSIFELGCIIRHISRHKCLERVMSCGTTSLGGLCSWPVSACQPVISNSKPHTAGMRHWRRAVSALASIAASRTYDNADRQWGQVAQVRKCAAMCLLLCPSAADFSKARTLKSDRGMVGLGLRFLGALSIPLRSNCVMDAPNANRELGSNFT